MASCEPKLYNCVSAAMFDVLKEKLHNFGIDLGQELKGRIDGPMGVVMDYGFDPDSQKLAIQVVEKNFLIGCKQIEGLVEGALREAGWE